MTLQSGSVAIYVMLRLSETGKTDRFDWIHTNTKSSFGKIFLGEGKRIVDIAVIARHAVIGNTALRRNSAEASCEAG